MSKGEKILLFICIENSGTSQMAEGFFNSKYRPRGYRAKSAGTRPAPQINPLAVQPMKEVGIDIGVQKSKVITEDMIGEWDKAINMGLHGQSKVPDAFHKQRNILGN